MVFNFSHQSFHDEASKILYVIAFLQDCTLRWAEAFAKEHSIERTAYDEFLELFSLAFPPVKSEEESAKTLCKLIC